MMDLKQAPQADHDLARALVNALSGHNATTGLCGLITAITYVIATATDDPEVRAISARVVARSLIDAVAATPPCKPKRMN